MPLGQAQARAVDFISQFILSGGDKTRLEEEVKAIVANPALFAEDPLRKEFAKSIVNAPPPSRANPVPWRQWGEGLEHEAIMQMEKACLLPVAVAGALMPDAHVGYGLPIGGVLATENAVIPYAVGVDIACRMKMTVLDIRAASIWNNSRIDSRAPSKRRPVLASAANFKNRREHDVLDADWSVSPDHPPEQGQGLVATRHERKRQPFRRVWIVHRARAKQSGSFEPAAGLTLRCSSHSGSRGHRRGSLRSLQQARVQPGPGFAERTETARVALAGFAGRTGILGRDGIDGPIRGGATTRAFTGTSPRISARKCCSIWRTTTISRGRRRTSLMAWSVK